MALGTRGDVETWRRGDVETSGYAYGGGTVCVGIVRRPVRYIISPFYRSESEPEGWSWPLSSVGERDIIPGFYMFTYSRSAPDHQLN